MPELRKIPLLALTGLLLSGFGAQAQVYQSTDEEGNVSFSDTPTSGSEAISIETPNVGDSVEVPPPAPEPVVEPEPVAKPEVDTLPPELEGELLGREKRSKKNRRPRKEPRGRR